MKELTIIIDSESLIPLYEQIYDYIKEEIKKGNLDYNYKLPSTRKLAEYLQVSRTTVDMAYSQLLSEGYIYSISCKGYFVAEVSLLYNIKIKEEKLDNASTEKKENFDIDFSPRGVDLSYFPFNVWRKLMKSTLNYDRAELFLSGDKKGEENFRETICSYLYESRGVKCDKNQIIIGAGSEYLLLLVNHLIKKNSYIASENPTYMKAMKLFAKEGHVIVPINVDKEGLITNELSQSKADYVYVTPSHQFPLGVIMTIKRRLELLKWASEKTDRYIIEDDYNSEFRYKGKPIPALYGLDSYEKVIYMGTFSKSIAPGLRMSYMVLPKKLMSIYEEKLDFFSSTVSRVDQNIVNDFMKIGAYERHLNKMRSVYRIKHDILINELKQMNIDYEISGESAGIHILIQIKKDLTEKELIDSAKKEGVKVYSLSEYYYENTYIPKYPTIILGFANLEEKDIKEGIKRLKKAWE